MVNVRWTKTILAALAAVVLSLGAAALAGTASAAPPRAGADASISSSDEPLVTAAAQKAGQEAVGKGRKASAEQALAAYWTPERMRSALSADELPGLGSAIAAQKERASNDAAKARGDAARGAKPEPVGPAGKVEPQAPLGTSPALATSASRTLSATLAPYPYYSFPARTAGKVFFTNAQNGLNYVCSGTIVNSEGKNSVWTAGHCVHGGSGGTWHANWVFVPSYDSGWAPYGQWTARQLWTKTNWISSSEWASDMGVAIMHPRNGWRIVDYLGGQGITWNQSKNIGVTAFGYPAAYPFNGSRLYLCTGTTFPEWVILWWSAETLGLRCDMTGGSSGGGWLAFYNGTTGYLNGNNSFKYTNDANTMYSPYYDDTASSLYSSTRYL